MARSRSILSLVAGLGVAVLVWRQPAAAQFNSIFGDFPRPPADVPNRVPPRALPANPAPVAPDMVQRPAGAPAPAGIQTAPLPPPPGTEPVEPQQSAQPPQPGPAQPGPLPGLPPGQRQPRGTPQPANATPQPGDEVVTELPSQRITNPTAVFSGLDKITGRITTFEVTINETVQFGALQVTPRVCYTRPPTETPKTDGFVEVDEITLQGEVRRIFSGWMFAASPGLHAVEHPIYDVWFVDCKNPSLASAPAQAANASIAPLPNPAPAPTADPPPSGRTPARSRR